MIYCENCDEEKDEIGSESVTTYRATLEQPAEGYSLCAECVEGRPEPDYEAMLEARYPPRDWDE